MNWLLNWQRQKTKISGPVNFVFWTFLPPHNFSINGGGNVTHSLSGNARTWQCSFKRTTTWTIEHTAHPKPSSNRVSIDPSYIRPHPSIHPPPPASIDQNRFMSPRNAASVWMTAYNGRQSGWREDEILPLDKQLTDSYFFVLQQPSCLSPRKTGSSFTKLFSRVSILRVLNGIGSEKYQITIYGHPFRPVNLEN